MATIKIQKKSVIKITIKKSIIKIYLILKFNKGGIPIKKNKNNKRSYL